VAVVEMTFSDTFAGIIIRPKGNPLDRRYIQFASDSTAASMIAARPPYSRKVRKIAASEKLIANFDLGSGSDIRGATVTEKTISAPKPSVIADTGTVKSA
jgi:hypothetical protein